MNEFVPEPTSRQVWCMRLCRSLKSDDMRRRFWTLANAATLMPALDGERLAEAWRATLEANPALRCTFTEDGDAIIAQVLPLDHFPVKQIDTEGWSADEVIASVNATTADYAPLDGPLAMLTHYRSSTSSTLLALFHHGLIDGTAMTLLIRELIGAYLLGRPPNARATGNFAEFAAWQRDFLAGPAGARQFDYWMGQLADLPPPLPLPYDRPDNHRFTDGRYLSCAVAPSVAEGVRVLARSLGVPPFRPLWAAFNISIAAMTGVDDAPIVCSVANRTNRRFRETIGWLANAVHLRCAIESGERVRAYCARVSRMVDAAIDNQEYPRNLVDDALEAQFPGDPDRDRPTRVLSQHATVGRQIRAQPAAGAALWKLGRLFFRNDAARITRMHTRPDNDRPRRCRTRRRDDVVLVYQLPGGCLRPSDCRAARRFVRARARAGD